MKKYKVTIKTPNRMFSVNGILVRTPAQWTANESELGNIKLKIESDAIDNYTIEDYDPHVAVKPKQKVQVEKVVEPKPKKKKEAVSILEKIVEDDN